MQTITPALIARQSSPVLRAALLYLRFGYSAQPWQTATNERAIGAVSGIIAREEVTFWRTVQFCRQFYSEGM